MRSDPDKARKRFNFLLKMYGEKRLKERPELYLFDCDECDHKAEQFGSAKADARLCDMPLHTAFRHQWSDRGFVCLYHPHWYREDD